MTQGIETRYIGATNTKPSRFAATARKARNGMPALALKLSASVEALDHENEHCRAAKALATQLDWRGLWIAGGSADEQGFNWSNLPGSYSRAWVDKYIAGEEGRDWFFLPEKTLQDHVAASEVPFTHAAIKKGSRVRYTGTTCPGLTGKSGTVDKVDRKGWVHVTFDGSGMSTKCDESNLTAI